MDTINVNGKSKWLHPSVSKKYFTPMDARGVEKIRKELSKPTLARVKGVKEIDTVVAKEAATGEHLT